MYSNMVKTLSVHHVKIKEMCVVISRDNFPFIQLNTNLVVLNQIKLFLFEYCFRNENHEPQPLMEVDEIMKKSEPYTKL